MANVSGLTLVPDDLLCAIFDLLGPLELAGAQRVCGHWARAVGAQRLRRLSSLFALWEEFCLALPATGDRATVVFSPPAASFAPTPGVWDRSFEHVSRDLLELNLATWWAPVRDRLLHSGADRYARYQYTVIPKPHTSRLAICVPMGLLPSDAVDACCLAPGISLAVINHTSVEPKISWVAEDSLTCVNFNLDIQWQGDPSNLFERQRGLLQAALQCLEDQVQNVQDELHSVTLVQHPTADGSHGPPTAPACFSDLENVNSADR